MQLRDHSKKCKLILGEGLAASLAGATRAVRRSKGPMSAHTSAFGSLAGPTRAPNAARVSSRRATRGAFTVAAAGDSTEGARAERVRMNVAFPTEEQAEMMEKLGFDEPAEENTVPLVADKFKWDEDRPFHRCAPRTSHPRAPSTILFSTWAPAPTADLN